MDTIGGEGLRLEWEETEGYKRSMEEKEGHM